MNSPTYSLLSKHFVGCEVAEARIIICLHSGRSSRDVYLPPCRAAAGHYPMTSFNDNDGVLPETLILEDVFRGEWGFTDIGQISLEAETMAYVVCCRF